MTYQKHSIVDYLQVVGPDSVLVDVREPSEVAEGTLPDSVNIPVGEISARVGELDSYKRVVLFCRSGGRSGQAAQFLVDAGFGDVINLEGGMLAWAEQNG